MGKIAKLFVLMFLVMSVPYVSAATVNVTDGFVYGHCYLGWGNPQGFSMDDIFDKSSNASACVGMSGDGPSIVFPPTTTLSNPGYFVYKFVAPAGQLISNVSLSTIPYIGGNGGIDAYYTMADYTGAPDFSGWTKITSSDFAPNANQVYIAYVGWNSSDADWKVQMTKDQVTFAVVPEFVSTSINVTDGLVYGHCYAGWGNPRGFSVDDIFDKSFNTSACIGMSGDGPSIMFPPTTSSSNPGYFVYKFVAPAGQLISNVTLSPVSYLGGNGGIDTYYTTADYTGAPDFSGWTKLTSSDFVPNANQVYIAYVGWNSSDAGWKVQMIKDQASFTVIPEFVSTSINVTDGLVYGHCYAGWGNPRGFSVDDIFDKSFNTSACIGMSGDGPSIIFPPTTSSSNPGYFVYKFVAPAGQLISNVTLSPTVYIGGAGSIDAYYTTVDYTGAPDFSGWTKITSSDFAPNAHQVYIAYVGWNSSDAGWKVQMTKDQVTFAVGAELAATPTFIPEGGIFGVAKAVTVNCATPGVAIYCTTNGSEPSETNGTLVASGGTIMVNQTSTLKAKAFVAGYSPSLTKSGDFTIVTSYNRPEVISIGSAAVDGDLSDWAGSTWAPLDKMYDGVNATDPLDVTEAAYTARWNPADNKIYVAIRVRDTQHAFVETYQSWSGQDAVEIYLHTTSVDGFSYKADQSTAQQYVVGLTGETTNQVWAIMSDKGVLPESTGFIAAGKTGSDGWICYEASVNPFKYFGGLLSPVQPNIGSTLMIGDVIGLDVCVVSNDGTTNPGIWGEPGYNGMKGENQLIGKSADWRQIALHRLVYPGDANCDSLVDVGDLGILAANYGQSNKTWAQGDFNGDGLVDVGDLGILAAHYGEGSTSTANFSADYAKAFGTVVTDDQTEMEDNSSSSICSGLGLPLIAGLMLLGLMLVKLEEQEVL
jgi:hypothetical protein